MSRKASALITASLFLIISSFSSFSATAQNELHEWSVGGEVTSIAITPDGYYAAAGCADENTYLFGKESEGKQQTWSTSSSAFVDSSIVDVEISSRSGTYLDAYVASASVDGNIYFYKSTSATKLSNKTLLAAPSCIASNGTSRYTVAGTASAGGFDWASFAYVYHSYIYLFSRSGDTISIPSAWSTPYDISSDSSSIAITAIDISRDGAIIAAGCENGKAYIFTMVAGKNVQKNPSFDSAITDLALSNAGSKMAIAYGNYVEAYDTASGIRYAANSGSAVSGVSISGSGTRIAAASGSKVILYSVGPNLPKSWEYTSSGTVTTVEISNDGDYIIAGDSSGKVLFFHASSNVPIWNASCGSAIASVAIDDNGNYAAAGGKDSKVHLYSPEYGIQISTPQTASNALPGAAKTHPITVKNTGNRHDEITISKTGTNADWASLGSSSSYLAPGASTIINCTVSIPPLNSIAFAGAKSAVDVKAASSGAASIGESRQATIRITTTVSQVYGAQLSCVMQQKNVDQGENASYAVLVRNTGNGLDTISLSVVQTTSFEGWSASLSSQSISKNGSKADNYSSVVVTVSAPANAINGDLAAFKVIAKPMNGAGQEKTINLTTAVNPIYEYGIAPKEEGGDEMTVASGESAVFVFVIQNTGNAMDTFNITASRGTLDYGQFDLGAGESREISLTVNTASSESGTASITLTAKSNTGNHKEIESMTLQITKKTPGFEIVALCLAGALALLIRKRR